MSSPFSVLQVKREADALIDHGVPGPLFCRYTALAPPGEIPPAERQRYLTQLVLWMTSAAASHVRLGSRSLTSVTQRFAQALMAFPSWEIQSVLRPFMDAMLTVNPDLAQHAAAHGQPSSELCAIIQDSLMRQMGWTDEQRQAIQKALTQAAAPASGEATASRVSA